LIHQFDAGPTTSRQATPPDPPTLQEIGEGRTIPFDGETPSGWTIDGEVRVEKGVLVRGGGTRTTVTLACGYADLCWGQRREPPPPGPAQQTTAGGGDASGRGGKTLAGAAAPG
jgi:hypothetical protein